MNFVNTFQISGYVRDATKVEPITFSNGTVSNKFTIEMWNTDSSNSKENVFYIEIIANETRLRQFEGCLFANQSITVTGDLVSAPYVNKMGQKTAFLRLRAGTIMFPQLGRQIELRNTMVNSVVPKTKPLLMLEDDDKPSF